MEPSGNHERPGNELMFRLLRTLMVGYFVWGVQAGVKLSELCTILCTTEGRLQGMLFALAQSGWIARDDAAGTVWLTARGAREFSQSAPDAPPLS